MVVRQPRFTHASIAILPTSIQTLSRQPRLTQSSPTWVSIPTTSIQTLSHNSTPVESTDSPQTSGKGLEGKSEPRRPQTTGIIIGAVVGFIVFLALIIAAICIRRRSTRKGRPFITPYPDSLPINKKGRHKHHDVHGTRDSEEEGVDRNRNEVVGLRNDTVVEPQGTSGQQLTGRWIRYHEDSGWRPRPPPSESGTGNSDVIDMPPQYNTAI
ncbi:hypothetical protein VNI00_018719 [Paramarasmius palmivorus]|uniref:Mid2 domain-containing protein n=1 Tax=Paramarasmius palmivorus TaxID=297713 RepID=A0AAW0AV05_9AGAR